MHTLKRSLKYHVLAVVAIVLPRLAPAAEQPLPQVPEGFAIEVAAAAPLVGHPMLGCFDDRGRLYLSESAGMNLDDKQLDRLRPNFIRRLEDTNRDGVFDRSTIFADKLCIPNGALWLDGDLYVAEPPGIWRFRDTDDDGVADVRQHIAGQVNSNGMSSTLHGPVLHPSGRLFWCGGQMGFNLERATAPTIGRMAPGVFCLKPDGSEHEMFAVGGLANPVEVAFTDEGEVLGTIAIHQRVDGERRDALMHWVYGGVSNHNPASPCALKRTGPFLPALSDVGQVAPAGLACYRGTQFGRDYQGDIFWSQFNTHKVVRTRLTRRGGTFTARDEDFLVSEDVDFHPTDVIEDADGSLLVIDTGGWFRHGCPTSHLANREAKGAIYRIRRQGADSMADPRGLQIVWEESDAAPLVKHLGDSRPAVQERAIASLARLGDSAGGELDRVLATSDSTASRRNAVWTLARIDTPGARGLLRRAIQDDASSVRQSAVTALGLARDAAAATDLETLATSDPSGSVRREAAAALGRIGEARAVPALLSALGAADDLFLQHAIIFALIELNRADHTLAGLADSDPRVRRGALLALSQMAGAELNQRQIAPLLRSEDLELKQAAFQVAARSESLRPELLQAAGEQLASLHGPAEQVSPHADVLRELLISLTPTYPEIERLVGEQLLLDGASKPARLMLVEVMRQAAGKRLPAEWIAGLERELARGDESTLPAIAALVQQRAIGDFDAPLRQIARDAGRPVSLRMASLTAIASRLSPVGDELFDFACAQLTEEQPLARLAAARALASLCLSEQQLVSLAGQVPQADALILPSLLAAFSKHETAAIGLALVRGLDQSSAARNLSPDELARLLAKYPQSVIEAAGPLFQELHASLAQQQARLEESSELLAGGDVGRGKQVFFGKTTNCATCHQVSGQGGLIGPNLSAIAEVRQGRDFLESVLYPSASIVQGYRPLAIETTDGRIVTGIVTREAPDVIWLRTGDLAEVRVEVTAIESMAESPVSLMPQGLETRLSRDELRDLLAYLQSLKRLTSFAVESP